MTSLINFGSINTFSIENAISTKKITINTLSPACLSNFVVFRRHRMETGAQAEAKERAARPRRRQDGVTSIFSPCLLRFTIQASIYQQSAKEVQCGGKSGR